MTAIKISQAELEALAGLPSLAFRIYILGIRPFMDYSTGLVGVQRRISWQGLREAGYIEPHQGLQASGMPSRMQARRAVDWLIRSGLVIDQTQGKLLILYCPLADTDASAQKKPNPNPTGTQQTQSDPHPDQLEALHGGVLRGHPDLHPDPNPTGPGERQPNSPPESGVRKGESPHTEAAYREASADTTSNADVCAPAAMATGPANPAAAANDRLPFDRFWSAYPRQVKKREAYQIFRDEELERHIETILIDLEQRPHKDRRWRAGYIPNPGNYLRERRWQEPIEMDRQAGRQNQPNLDGHAHPAIHPDEAEAFASAGFATDPDW